MSLDAHYLELLKTTLRDNFVPHLPPLLDTTKPPAEQEKKNLSRAFNAFVLKCTCEISENMSSSSVVDDFDDKGLDAIYYDGVTLYLIQSKLKSSEKFDQDDANVFSRGVRKIIRQDFSDFNNHLLKRQTEIEDAVQNCSRIQLIIAHVGSGMSDNAKQIIDELIAEVLIYEERLEKKLTEIDHNVVKNYLQSGNTYEPINTDLYIEACKSIDNPRVSYFGLVSVQNLVDLHNKYDRALYEKNIRTFLGLGLKQGVNEAIQHTLKTNPDEFWYFNNGVTALCENIEPKHVTSDGRRKLVLSGFSVINGAQTIASAAQISGSDDIDISSAKIMLTLIKANKRDEFGVSVTKSRNHQNPVSLTDFVALEEDQERLRRETSYLDIHYDYKPGIREAEDSQSITLHEAIAALALLNRDPRYAVWIKKEPNNLYRTDADPYKGMFVSTLSPYSLINAVRFYRYVQKRMLTESQASNGLTRLTYKHGNYVLGWILAKRITKSINTPTLMNEVMIEASLSLPFDELRQKLWDKTEPLLENIGDIGPLALFGNQTHVIPLMKSIMLDYYGLNSDRIIGFKEAKDYSGQPYQVDLFNYLVSRAPQIEIN